MVAESGFPHSQIRTRNAVFVIVFAKARTAIRGMSTLFVNSEDTPRSPSMYSVHARENPGMKD